MNNDYMKIKDAAALLKVTPLTLRNWDKKGLLAAYRHPVNNYRLYRTSDIQNLLSRIEQPHLISVSPGPAMDQESSAGDHPDPEPLPPPVQKLAVMFEDEV